MKDLCLTAQFGQCDGITNPDGKPLDDSLKCCPEAWECVKQNDYYSQCAPIPHDDDDHAHANEQCGGEGWTGPTECETGYECVYKNEYYSGCNQIPVCTNGYYMQCGGIDDDGNPWLDNHDDCCPPTYSCVFRDQYYSQCKPDEAVTA